MLKPIFTAELCRPFRRLPAGCRRCADACSAGVLAVGGDGVAVADGCQACGRCAAACPAGALSMAGFPTIDAILREPAATVECRRVPERLSGGAMRVPCLGGLDEEHLLALHLSAGCRAVHLVDRGWCRDCPAGGAGEHPAAEALRATTALLAAAGTDPAAVPRLVQVPTPPQLRRNEAPTSPARRALFGRLFGGGAAATPERTETVRPLPRRARALAMLARIQRRRGASLPDALLPALRIGSTCTDCGVCAALCPTGALARYEDGGAVGLSFDAARCTACGRCAAVCRAGAVAVARRHEAAATGRTILTRFEARACLRCETEFAGDGEERFCPRCRLERSLFSHAPGRATTGSEPSAVHG